jgi:hypothetical protein
MLYLEQGLHDTQGHNRALPVIINYNFKLCLWSIVTQSFTRLAAVIREMFSASSHFNPDCLQQSPVSEFYKQSEFNEKCEVLEDLLELKIA